MFGNKMNAVEKAVKKNHAAALIDLSQDKDKDVVMAAIAGMVSVGGDEVAHYLITRLQDPEPEMRTAVAQTLGNIGNKHTKAFLAAQLQKEKDEAVKEAILQAMVKIKGY